MGDHNNAKLHIAMFPWLAFGHLIPFLELAKLLAYKGHKISFISTPRNIDRLPQIPQTLTPFITFIKLNLPKWILLETEIKPSIFQLIRGYENFKAVEENVSDMYRLGATVRGCDAVIVRTSFDFEPEWLNLLNELYKKPVIPAGLLPALEATECHACWPETKRWLDMQEKGSVVYIAFGTETKPSQYELTQLALGLELCGLPFYWVLIDKRGSSDDDVVELPRGFEERTRGRGVVCRGWAPQFKILSHNSVGGLLIHSGMSSVVEGFQLGKPLVLLPCMVDQGLIASYLVEKKMAYRIYREDVDGSFTPESVADSLSLVMVSEEGKM